jgi:hypothetical protein
MAPRALGRCIDAEVFMSLPQPLPELTPARAPQRQRRSRQLQSPQRQAQRQHRALAWEMTLRLSVNMGISLVALAALARLIPYHQAQRQALQEVAVAVTEAEATTEQLQADFSRYFDPAQASRILQAEGSKLSGQSIPIVLVDPLNSPNASTD